MGDRLKQYVYTPQECGRDSWPSGELRLEGAITVEHPNDADVFVVPGALFLFKDDFSVLDRLPYMAGRENRHVMFDVSDYITQPLHREWIMLRCDIRNWMMKDDPNGISMAWPVEDYSECIELPEGGFKYDVTFRGWLSTDTRRASSDACKNHPSLKCDIEQYADFTGYLHDRTTNQWNAEGLRRREGFRRGMKESRIALCPESIPGVFPYRFWEAMSAGRVPLLIGSDFVFPFRDEIPYGDFIFKLDREYAHEAAIVVNDRIRQTSDDELIEMGKLARHYWELYLDCRKWPSLMQRAVEKQLDKMGVVCS